MKLEGKAIKNEEGQVRQRIALFLCFEIRGKRGGGEIWEDCKRIGKDLCKSVFKRVCSPPSKRGEGEGGGGVVLPKERAIQPHSPPFFKKTLQVTLTPEEIEDLWLCYNLIVPGDSIRTSTMR